MTSTRAPELAARSRRPGLQNAPVGGASHRREPPTHLVGRALGGLRDLLLPAACAVCRAPVAGTLDGIVCASCLAQVVAMPHPHCERCGHPRLSPSVPLPTGLSPTGAPDELPPCRWCARLPSHVRAVRSVCRMDAGSGAALVHALKYEGWAGVAPSMAARMARLHLPRDVTEERSALIPVPLAPTRERERGYNQAERLASALAAHWHLPVWRDVLTRTRHTRSQVRLTPSERTGNVSHAFRANPSARARLLGAHVVLVDDVITTASTLNASADALVAGGARIISYITFGRAPEPGDRTVPDLDFDQD